jgi:hypothetical protein
VHLGSLFRNGRSRLSWGGTLLKNNCREECVVKLIVATIILNEVLSGD